MSNTRTNTDQGVKQGTAQNVENELEIKEPENYDVMLVNSHTAFEAIYDILSEVLETTRARAMQIAMHAHMNGMASVFTGPKDMADTYQAALMQNAQEKINDPDYQGMEVQNVNFIVEKVKK